MNEEITKELPSLEGATALEIAEAIAAVLDAKKGKDVKIIHVEEKTVIAEYFVLCTGNSSTQVKGLVGEVEYQLERRGVTPYNIEGKDNNSWILMDYSNIIVHVFSREAREFYNLDKLYGDSSAIAVSTED